MSPPEPFLLANHLLGPSYVSMEAALAYWGWIPEKVIEISSMTIWNSTVYNSDVGRYTYTHLPLPYYSFGLQCVELTQKQTAMVAAPEKALCDKIATTAGVLLRSSNQVMEFLIDDLRIDEERLGQIDGRVISSWVTDSPKKSSIDMLIKTLSR